MKAKYNGIEIPSDCEQIEITINDIVYRLTEVDGKLNINKMATISSDTLKVEPVASNVIEII
jgi:hypothetical protein